MINSNRRKFIKTSLLCGGFFFFGKIAGSLITNSTKLSTGDNDYLLGNNKREDEKRVAYYDNNGNKVLVVEK